MESAIGAGGELSSCMHSVIRIAWYGLCDGDPGAIELLPPGCAELLGYAWCRWRFYSIWSLPLCLLPDVTRKRQHGYHNIRSRYWRPKKPMVARRELSSLARQSFIAFPFAPTLGFEWQTRSLTAVSQATRGPCRSIDLTF